MKIRQLSIFLENTAGRLYDIVSVLGKSKINIRALSLADTAEFGILRLIVDKVDKAYEELKKSKHTVSITEVVAVEVADKPGGLAEVLGKFAENNINVEYMYAFVEKKHDNAILIFRIEDLETAIEVIKKAGVKMVDHEQLMQY